MRRSPRSVLGLFTAALIAASAWQATPAAAQAYPARDIKAFLGFAGGSGADIQARFFVERMSAKLGKLVIIENKPGAVGNIAAESVARSRPDGYTILIAAGSASMSANIYLFKKLPYDPVKDFVPISTFAKLAFVLMTAPNTPVKSVAELTDYLKKKGKVAYGTSNTTGLAAAALYTTSAGIEAIQVPYRQTADGMNDLIGNQIDFMFMDAVFGLEQARSGRIKALAVTSAERSSWAPELPSMAESGVPGFDLSPWWAFYAPTGTPQPILDRLAAVIVEIGKSAEAKEFLNRGGAEPFLISSKEAVELQRLDTLKWGEIAKVAKIDPQ